MIRDAPPPPPPPSKASRQWWGVGGAVLWLPVSMLEVHPVWGGCILWILEQVAASREPEDTGGVHARREMLQMSDRGVL